MIVLPGRAQLKTLWRQGRHAVSRRFRRPAPGRFQPYSHTLPDRYPWLFEFARAALGDVAVPRLLSFGCSRGDEVFALRRHFPGAAIKGVDIDPRNIAVCRARASRQPDPGIAFVQAGATTAEPTAHYDAIFCLAVLCHGDLAASFADRCDPLIRFDDFERVTADFTRCLTPGGLLFLHTTNFRFGDTEAAAGFDVVLEAELGQLASDPIFDRDNRRIDGLRYRPVGFRKRVGDG